MNTRIYLFIFITSFIFFACESKNEQLKEEVIAIHDEVMPHMGHLKSLEKEMQQQADQLIAEDSAGQHQQIQLLRNTAAELNQAYDEMFVWMRQFEPNQEERTDEEFNIYLQEQKVLVEKVKQDVNQALEKAEQNK